MNTLITRIIFPNHWKIILIISCLKQRKCQYAYLNANIIRCLIWKKLSFKSNHLIFHLIWDFEDFWPDMTSYFMYLVICPILNVNFLWICHVNVLESGSFPFIGISWRRIPTVKLKIPGKSMGKAGYRTSVTFKLKFLILAIYQWQRLRLSKSATMKKLWKMFYIFHIFS